MTTLPNDPPLLSHLTSLPPELLLQICQNLDTLSLTKICRTSKYLYASVIPILFETIRVNVAGSDDQSRAHRRIKQLSTSLNLDLVKIFVLDGVWQDSLTTQESITRSWDEVPETEIQFGKEMLECIGKMTHIEKFHWRIICYFPQEIVDKLVLSDSLTHFEAFVDPRISYVKCKAVLGHGLYPGTICPIGIHHLTSLHALQLSTIRQCALFGDVIRDSPMLKSLWLDTSPVFRELLENSGIDELDILSILLRPRVSRQGHAVEVEKYKFTDIRMGNMSIGLPGIIAFHQCVDISRIETLVLHYCDHRDFIESIVSGLVNMKFFQADEEGNLGFLENMVGSCDVLMQNGTMKGMESLSLSCTMERNDGLSLLAPQLSDIGRHLKRLVLDLNWGEFEYPQTILAGCPELVELAVWIEDCSSQWDRLIAAVANHPTLTILCIFSNDLYYQHQDTLYSRLHGCVTSNMLGPAETLPGYHPAGGGELSIHSIKPGHLRYIGIRCPLETYSVFLKVWKIFPNTSENTIEMRETPVGNIFETTLFHDVLTVDYFY